MLGLVETGSVVAFDEAAARVDALEVLHAEAAEAEHYCGKNPYSDFLRQHGHRPDRNQAATIGRLMVCQVRASDDSMQPPLTKAQREARRASRVESRHRARYRRQVARLREALLNLGENGDSPADVLTYVDTFDVAIIREHLDNAVEWLSRFAEEWHRGNSANEKVSDSLEGDGPRRKA